MSIGTRLETLAHTRDNKKVSYVLKVIQQDPYDISGYPAHMQEMFLSPATVKAILEWHNGLPIA